MNDIVKWIDETIEDACLSEDDFVKKYPGAKGHAHSYQAGYMKVVLENARREIVGLRKSLSEALNSGDGSYKP